MKRGNKAAVLFPVILLPVFLGLWMPEPLHGGGKAETEHFVVNDLDGRLTGEALERFAADAEAEFSKVVDFWSLPCNTEENGKILLELKRAQGGKSFTVFQIETGGEETRRVLRVQGIESPQELAHKMTHALFPTGDKLIRNMMGIPTETRFGNPGSFPMCGCDLDAWVPVLIKTGDYIPLSELRPEHEEWGMTFKDKTPSVSDRKKQHASYIEAGSFGSFLIRRFGIEKVKAFYQASLRHPRPWKKIFGLDLAGLEAEWLKTVSDFARENAAQAAFLETLWKKNPARACYEAQDLTRKGDKPWR